MNNVIHTATVLVLTACVAVGAWNMRILSKTIDAWAEVQRDALRTLTSIENELREQRRERKPVTPWLT